MKPMTEKQALQKLAVFCSTAERCKQDLEKKLIRWDIPHENHSAIIRKLQQDGFLNEERFCNAFVNDKIRFNKWGTRKIIYELKRKEIPEEIIRQTISKINPGENKDILKQLLVNKRKSVKGKNEFEIRQKLIRFAASRGFSIEEINRCMKDLFSDYEELTIEN